MMKLTNYKISNSKRSPHIAIEIEGETIIAQTCKQHRIMRKEDSQQER
jgi:hypothetical protein